MTANAAAVFTAALAQAVPLTVITSQNLSSLGGLNLSPEAEAHISAAVMQGEAVIVPVRPVSLDGVATTAWYEINLATGEAIGVTEDGGHFLVRTKSSTSWLQLIKSIHKLSLLLSIL